MPVTGKGKYPLRSAWLGRGRGLASPVLKQVLPSVSEQAGYTALSDYFFEAAASGGITQSLSITLDGVTVAVNQALQHSQSLAITLEGVTSSITQSLQHSQSLAITLDSLAVTINETLQHNQALAITLDGVTIAISQNASAGIATLTQSLGITLDDVSVSSNQQLQHSQSLAITLDDITSAANQTLQHTQSLAISLDDVIVSIGQQNETAPIVQGGGIGHSSKRERIIIIEVDGKDYRVPEDRINQFLASIKTETSVQPKADKAKQAKQVKRIGKSEPVVVVKSAPVDMVERLQQDFDYANAKINALFIKALQKYQQDLEDDEDVLLLLM